jgi:hypothetical protein
VTFVNRNLFGFFKKGSQFISVFFSVNDSDFFKPMVPWSAFLFVDLMKQRTVLFTIDDTTFLTTLIE